MKWLPEEYRNTGQFQLVKFKCAGANSSLSLSDASCCLFRPQWGGKPQVCAGKQCGLSAWSGEKCLLWLEGLTHTHTHTHTHTDHRYLLSCGNQAQSWKSCLYVFPLFLYLCPSQTFLSLFVQFFHFWQTFLESSSYFFLSLCLCGLSCLPNSISLFALWLSQPASSFLVTAGLSSYISLQLPWADAQCPLRS